MPSSGLYGADDRYTDNKAGLLLPPPPSSPPLFTPDALPDTTLPIYPGVEQAPSMMGCIPVVWS